MDGLGLSALTGDPRDQSRKYDDVELNDIDFDWVEKCTEPKLIRHAVKLLEPERAMYPQLYAAALEKFRALDPKHAPKEEVQVPASDVHSAIEDLFAWKSSIEPTDQLLAKTAQSEQTDAKTVTSQHSKSTKSSSKADQLLASMPIRGLDDGVVSTSGANTNIEAIPIHLRDPAVREAVALKEKTKGNEFYHAKEYVLARDAYSRGIVSDPSRLELYTNRAAACLKLDDFDQAELDCSHVLKVDSRNLKALLRRGTARQALGYYWQAVGDFESVLALQPNHLEATTKLAEAKQKANEHDPFRMTANDEVRVNRSTASTPSQPQPQQSQLPAAATSKAGEVFVNAQGKRVRRVLKKVTKQITVPSEGTKSGSKPKRIQERKRIERRRRTVRVSKPKEKTIKPTVSRTGMVLEEESEEEEVEQIIEEDVEVVERVEVSDEEDDEVLTLKTVVEDVWAEETASEDEGESENIAKIYNPTEVKYDDEVKGDDYKSSHPAPVNRPGMKRLTILEDDDDDDDDDGDDDEADNTESKDTASTSAASETSSSQPNAPKLDPLQDSRVVSALERLAEKKRVGNDLFKTGKLGEAATAYLAGISNWEALIASPAGPLADVSARVLALDAACQDKETVKQVVIALYTNLSLVLLQTFDRSPAVSGDQAKPSASLSPAIVQLLDDVVNYCTAALVPELDATNPKAFFRRALARRRRAQITLGLPINEQLPSEEQLKSPSYSRCRDALQSLRQAASDVTDALKKDSSKLAKAEFDLVTGLISVVQKAADKAQITPSEAKSIGQGLDVSFLENDDGPRIRTTKAKVVKSKPTTKPSAVSQTSGDGIATRKALDAAIVRYTSNPSSLANLLMTIPAERAAKVVGSSKPFTSEDVSAIVAALLTVDMQIEDNANRALGLLEALPKTPEFDMAATLVSDSAWTAMLNLVSQLENQLKRGSTVSSSYATVNKL